MNAIYPNLRSIYTEQQQHHTGRVKSLQARGIHDNYIIIFRTTNKHRCHGTNNPSKENSHNGVWIKPPRKVLNNVN
jgi:hypothetical protein